MGISILKQRKKKAVAFRIFPQNIKVNSCLVSIPFLIQFLFFYHSTLGFGLGVGFGWF